MAENDTRQVLSWIDDELAQPIAFEKPTDGASLLHMRTVIQRNRDLQGFREELLDLLTREAPGAGNA